jgi:hypothetical protein
VRTNGDTGKTVIKFYYYRIPPTLIRKDDPLIVLVLKSESYDSLFFCISWLIIAAAVQHDLTETQQIVFCNWTSFISSKWLPSSYPIETDTDSLWVEAFKSSFNRSAFTKVKTYRELYMILHCPILL